MILTDTKCSPKGKAIIKRYESLKSRRYNWEELWDEIGRYVIPRKNDTYNSRMQGERKGQYLFDGTSVHSNELLSSALHGMLTNPTTMFFGLTTGDTEMDKNDSIRKWFEKCVEITHNVLNNSNFQTEIHEVYTDLGGFGTAVMMIEEDDETVVRFRSAPIYQVYIAESNKGLVDTVFRLIKYTARQIAQEFGEDKLTAEMKQKMTTDPDQEYEIVHGVFPRTDDFTDFRFSKKHAKRKPWASFYVLVSGKVVLSESGFEEFPYVVPRWTKLSGEVYGRSPGMKAMPDIKMLNEMAKTVIRAAQLTVAPPMMITDDGMFRRVKVKPGALNYVRPGSEIKPLFTGADLRSGFEVMAEARNRVREAFFIDQLQLNEGPQMTATEVVQRSEEKLRLLGPILGRQQFELLRPTVERIFNILLRQGKFPEMPEELDNTKIDVQYSSTIAKAQRGAELDSFNRWFGFIAPLMQLNMNVLDNIDTDNAVRETALALGVKQTMLRDIKDVDSVRQERAQQMQQQMQMQEQQQGAQVAKDVSQAQLNDSKSLER